MAPRKIKVRPGKGQSTAAFFVGAVFVCIGLFIAIPTFGLFGILWTAVAVFLMVSHGKNAFTDKGSPIYEVDIDTESEKESIEERLRKLDSLYNQGLISKAELEEKRREILNEI